MPAQIADVSDKLTGTEVSFPVDGVAVPDISTAEERVWNQQGNPLAASMVRLPW